MVPSCTPCPFGGGPEGSGLQVVVGDDALDELEHLGHRSTTPAGRVLDLPAQQVGRRYPPPHLAPVGDAVLLAHDGEAELVARGGRDGWSG